MTETRTPKQIAADKLDLEMCRIQHKLHWFGAQHEERKIVEAAHQIAALRTRVRAHMHPKDREGTEA